MIKNIGIYAIRNNINCKVYIGSSRNIEGRWRVHKSRLRLNKHHSEHLQKSYNLENSFIYEILELVSDTSQLETREQYWIDHYQSYKSEFGYNAVRTVSQINPQRMKERWAKPGAKEIQSRKMKEVCSSKEHRLKLSLGHLEHFKDPNNKKLKQLSCPHRKKVICVETNQVFESIAEAAKVLSVSIVKIRDSINGKRKSNGGISFKLADK